MKEKKNQEINKLRRTPAIKSEISLPDNMFDVLDAQEIKIINYLLQENSFQEIAEKLNKSKSTIYRAFKKSVKKLQDANK